MVVICGVRGGGGGGHGTICPTPSGKNSVRMSDRLLDPFNSVVVEIMHLQYL